MDLPPMRTFEKFLQEKILPDLEKGRPDFDKPHTIAVVDKVKEIIKNSPQFEVDPIVLLIAAYAHDWGYCGLFRDGQALQLEDVAQAKTAHMQLGAEKLSKLLQNKIFSFLTKNQKERCVHLVSVHDKLSELKERDELILMEADTLGGLDTNYIKPTYNAESNRKFIEVVKKQRAPKFITNYGKRELPKLIQMRMDFYEKKK
ncbi:HD domain-containing protein [Patescibacteria group bacterium]|nr:HD domain-containing protein [Patescibacteria group bacterium]